MSRGQTLVIRTLAAASLAACVACRNVTGTYDPRHFADWPIDPAKKVDGCVTIATTPEEDAFFWRGMAGDMMKATVPVGVIAREAAVHVLGDLFRGGAVKATGTSASGCRVVLRPRVTRFEFPKLFGRPDIDLSITVEATNGSGATLLSKPYESGKVRIDTMSRAQPLPIVVAVHRIAQSLMLKAAADLKAELERAPPAAPAGAAPAAAAPGG